MTALKKRARTAFVSVVKNFLENDKMNFNGEDVVERML